MSLSDPSCRILVIATSLDAALAFIQRTRDNGHAPEPELADRDESDDDPVKIPWTITNKYYSADVHFAAHPVREFGPHLLKGVPAVVFVWTKGEPYRDDVERLSQDIQEHEPEVSLAVRMQAEGMEEEEEEEENGEIDEFLSSHGFEYVCVTDEAGLEFDEVPNFPRVIDALSTIMWPSIREERGLLVSEMEDMELWSLNGTTSDSPQLGFEDDFTGEERYSFLGSDEELPSQAEVLATHARIFGGGDDDIVGRLEEMRAEIAALEDEEERRRLAARIALGVVYGL